MIELAIRAATRADLPLLAAMNRRMVEDERNVNPMDLAALEARMANWLVGDWRVDLILADGETAGYAVYRPQANEYFPTRPRTFLRHFYVERELRGRGVGRRAFAALVAERFPPGGEVVLEVLESNPGGRRFWERMGLWPHCTTMILPAEA